MDLLSSLCWVRAAEPWCSAASSGNNMQVMCAHLVHLGSQGRGWGRSLQ